jgi:FKBP-type peptidyl-prolyl cis-trans isomerase
MIAHTLIFLCLLTVSSAATPAPASTPFGALPNDAYAAVGSSFAGDNRLPQLGWSEAQVEAFLAGVRAAFQGAPVPMNSGGQALLQAIGRRMAELDREELRQRFGAEAFARPGYLSQYLRDMQKRFDLQVSDSGLLYGIKTSGQGARPEPEDTVVLSFKVNAADMQTEIAQLGGQRLRFKVRDVMPGLSEALQMMSAGSSAMVILPPELSYGTGEWPAGAEPGTPLIFTLVLHEIISAPAP